MELTVLDRANAEEEMSEDFKDIGRIKGLPDFHAQAGHADHKGRRTQAKAEKV